MNKLDGIDESDLLDSLQRGNENAFNRVFLEYYPTLCQFAEQYVNDQADAEDVVVNVFLGLLDSKHRYNDLQHLRASLFRSIRHRII